MMELLLRRRASLKRATLGELYADGHLACFTLEDIVREIPGRPVAEWKIAGETAIPAGRYQVVITHSARFGRELPLLAAVPGFTGVRMHPGNTAADTEGCILVGTQIAGETIVESRSAFASLFARIRQALDNGEQVWLEIRNAAPAVQEAA